MNDFTKEELEYMIDILKIHVNDYPTLTSRDSDFLSKIQSMIDNYNKHDAKWIAKAHLREASTLIMHAMGLMGMDDE